MKRKLFFLLSFGSLFFSQLSTLPISRSPPKLDLKKLQGALLLQRVKERWPQISQYFMTHGAIHANITAADNRTSRFVDPVLLCILVCDEFDGSHNYPPPPLPGVGNGFGGLSEKGVTDLAILAMTTVLGLGIISKYPVQLAPDATSLDIPTENLSQINSVSAPANGPMDTLEIAHYPPGGSWTLVTEEGNSATTKPDGKEMPGTIPEFLKVMVEYSGGDPTVVHISNEGNFPPGYQYREPVQLDNLQRDVFRSGPARLSHFKALPILGSDQPY